MLHVAPYDMTHHKVWIMHHSHNVCGAWKGSAECRYCRSELTFNSDRTMYPREIFLIMEVFPNFCAFNEFQKCWKNWFQCAYCLRSDFSPKIEELYSLESYFKLINFQWWLNQGKGSDFSLFSFKYKSVIWLTTDRLILIKLGLDGILNM